MPSLKLIKHVPIQGTIECLTGLRIGGTKDDIEIGGMDNPIIRDPRTRRPYIPGSSLKGKMRSVLEYHYGKVGSSGQPCGCARTDCMICIIFGPHIQGRREPHSLGPTRILVRDALMDLDQSKEADKWVEVKSENLIDRRTGIALHPRPTERVVPGAIFDFELSIRVFQEDKEKELLETVQEGIQLIENEYLGSSGSRGYGKVKFHFTAPDQWRESG